MYIYIYIHTYNIVTEEGNTLKYFNDVFPFENPICIYIFFNYSGVKFRLALSNYSAL